MALVDNDLLRAAFRQKWNGTDEVVNVLHFRVTETGTATDDEILDTITSRVNGCFTDIETSIPNNLVPNVVDWYNVTQDSPLGQRSWGSGYVGGQSTGEALPTQIAALILFGTAKKRCQGRIYLGPFAESAQFDSVWGSAFKTDLATFADDLIAAGVGPDGSAYQYVVYSRSQGDTHVPTSRRVVEVCATMRSRRLGRGS